LETHSEVPTAFGAAPFPGDVPPRPAPTPLMLAEPWYIVELFPRLREAAGWHREPWRFERRRKEESLIGLRSGRRSSPCAVFLLLFWQARWFPSLPGDKRRTAPPSAPAG